MSFAAQRTEKKNFYGRIDKTHEHACGGLTRFCFFFTLLYKYISARVFCVCVFITDEECLIGLRASTLYYIEKLKLTWT